MFINKVMKILRWDKQDDIFLSILNPLYKTTDYCEVYYVEGKGFAVLNTQPLYPLYRRLGIPEIQDIYVLPDYRREGVATALIQHCEELVETDMVGISVPVSPDYGAAQRLYYKLGYEPDGNGVTYDRESVTHGSMVRLDENLCLMMVKDLKADEC